ncbi:indole-3-glycerol phosphate synthase [Desulfurella multipotens]|uniref:indole-3-glycerol-phosphate synthase n=1 Tax=Desulfurella multipotens TaxID=79269 RepID=A0A1G6IA61_9BACT|nr:indole-3-glycerol phosphate synthase TrpC [Desulfurella multipotens]SDC02636.1 indole-3-glycerol phosphate synthase [Desulfurella multipotens]
MIEQILADKVLEVQSMKVCPYKRTKPVLKPNFNDKINIIAEIKSKSPSYGNFILQKNIVEIYSKYAKAISVLTDNKYFGGSFEFLHEISKKTNLPILCKDFIIDKKQIDWAYNSGADIILLIVRALEKDKLRKLYDYACFLGLSVLIELHTENDLDKIDFDATIVGVNTRDLDTLKIDKNLAKKLISKIDAKIKIAESGVRNRNDIEEFLPYTNVFLIGEALLKSNDVESTFKELLCM